MLAAIVAAALAIAGGPPETYRGFALDAAAVPEERRDAVLAAARAQVDIVLAVGFAAPTIDVFRRFPVHLRPGTSAQSHFGCDGVVLSLSGAADDRPMLLHEYLHVYQARLLPGGARNPDLVRFFANAHRAGYPAGAYMLRNINEFFAMTGSVALYGRADRPPYTRANLTRRQPAYAAWLVRTIR